MTWQQDAHRKLGGFALALRAISFESSQDLWCWTVEHLKDIDSNFLLTLDWLRSTADNKRVFQAQQMTLQVHGMRDEIEKQSRILHEVLRSSRAVDRRHCLEAALPEIKITFFALLGCWATRSRLNIAETLSVCDEILGLSGLDDLREDWDAGRRDLAWGAAMFAQREVPYAPLLYDRKSSEPIPLVFIHDSTKLALNLARLEHSPLPRLGLAIANVLLSVCPRVVYGSPPAVSVNEARYNVLLCGARIVTLLPGVVNGVETSQRLVHKARVAIGNIALRSARSLVERFALSADEAAINDFSGELAVKKNKPEDAVRIHTEVLSQRELLLEQAETERAGDEVKRSLCVGLANTLWKLADAEMRTWQLDAAATHMERSIVTFRNIREAGTTLAGHLQAHAKIEFLRANFERAEALLEEADRERQKET